MEAYAPAALGDGTFTLGDTVLHTVPAAKTEILSYMNLYNDALTAVTVAIKINRGGSDVILWKTTLQVGDNVFWSGWVVLLTGNVVKTTASQSGPINYILSGSST